MSNKYLRFIPVIIWMDVIFFFSSQSTSGVPGTYNERFIILKSFHLIEYSTLAALTYFAVGKYKISILISYLYAITDEIHQSFTPGRTSKFTDTLIDLLGIAIGLTIIYLMWPVIKKYFKK